MPEINDPYTAATQYRHHIAEILAMAVDRFTGMVVTWQHAGIYADEMKLIKVPNVPGPNYSEILEDGLRQLRALVTVK